MQKWPMLELTQQLLMSHDRSILVGSYQRIYSRQATAYHARSNGHWLTGFRPLHSVASSVEARVALLATADSCRQNLGIFTIRLYVLHIVNTLGLCRNMSYMHKIAKCLHKHVCFYLSPHEGYILPHCLLATSRKNYWSEMFIKILSQMYLWTTKSLLNLGSHLYQGVQICLGESLHSPSVHF